MVKVKNIREFTVAVSQFLSEQDLGFTSMFNRMRGMYLTLSKATPSQNSLQVHIIGGNSKQFKATLLSDGDDVTCFEADADEDFEKPLKAMVKKIKVLQNKSVKNPN